MLKDLDHLPSVQQLELEQAKNTLMTEFELATSRATQPWKKNGRILKIILFGSYARKDWVDEPLNGYQSDFDLLIIVSHPKLTDISEFWYVAEDKMDRDPEIGRQVNIIVHTLQEVNEGLSRGEYFWTDIERDGVLLYELPGSTLSVPKPLTPADAAEMAESYYSEWMPGVERAIVTASEQIQKGVSDLGWRKEAAFSLHQATERAYICFLLTRTLYFPRSHNIRFLRSLAEDQAPRLISAWPRDLKVDRRRFELLKRAYVEARYSASFKITIEDLAAIEAMVRDLRNIVELLCQERLAKLKDRTRH